MGNNRGYHGVVDQRSTDNNSRSGSSGNDSQKASESDLELLFLGYKVTPVWIHFSTDLSRTPSITHQLEHFEGVLWVFVFVGGDDVDH